MKKEKADSGSAQTVLVTGGAGYIGSHTVLALLAGGYQVVVADNLVNSSIEAVRRIEQLSGCEVNFSKADLCDEGQVLQLFEQNDIDAVIHFAALKAVGESVAEPLSYYENNLNSLCTLLGVMGAHRCERLVFSSSATVYSPQGEPPYDETAVLAASSPYGRTKLYGEQIIQDFAKADNGLRALLLRYFNPVGAHPSGLIGESPTGIPNNLFPYISRVAAGTLAELQIFGDDYATVDGTGVRDYVHVCDLADGHVAALSALDRIKGAEVVNLGTGRGYSVLEAIAAFRKASGREIPFRMVDRRPGDVATSLADPSKARSLLDWDAKRGIEEMCADAWRWQEGNPNGYDSA